MTTGITQLDCLQLIAAIYDSEDIVSRDANYWLPKFGGIAEHKGIMHGDKGTFFRLPNGSRVFVHEDGIAVDAVSE